MIFPIQPSMHTPKQARPRPPTLRLTSCLTALVALVLGSCASTPPPLPEKAKPVVALMTQRLALARDVAWTKRTNNLPVRDPAREAAVLERTRRMAEAADLDSAAALRFMRAQIEASCLQQEYWMRAWNHGQGPPAGSPPSLGDIRSRLDSSFAPLLAAWADTEGLTIPSKPVKARLMDAGISLAAAKTAAAGLAHTTPSPGRAKTAEGL